MQPFKGKTVWTKKTAGRACSAGGVGWGWVGRQASVIGGSGQEKP